MTLPRPTIERFWTHVERTSTCWLWTASLTGGYGRIRDADGRKIAAHRFAYEHFVAPIAVGLELDHLCRVTRCVNPGHLEPVGHRENVLRGEGVAALQVRRSACPKGHPYTDENTITEGRRRRCRVCRSEHSRRMYRQRLGQP